MLVSTGPDGPAPILISNLFASFSSSKELEGISFLCLRLFGASSGLEEEAIALLEENL